MRPPKGFENEKFPLRHRLIHSFGLSMESDAKNTALIPLVMSSNDVDVLPNTIQVNPHNSAFEEDFGPLCHDMSIIDRMRISLKFNITNLWEPKRHTSGISGAEVFTGDGIDAVNFIWRPIFNVYPEKLDAADDETGSTVAAILGLTKDATNEDIVPITTNKLSTTGSSDKVLPNSTVNAVQVIADYNMSTDFTMEDHVFNEDTLQAALKRYTNKGALRSCLGRTRHVTLTKQRPFKNFYIDKFVPRAIRRIQPYGFFAIQVHLPIQTHVSQYYNVQAVASGGVHIGVSMITNYHEWNFEHDQDRGTPT